jgi:hypothetical protein
MSRVLCILAVAAAAVTLAGGEPSPQDYTSATLESLGLETVKPHKDPKTGFIVGGKNLTPLIHKLTEIADLPIARLEKRMRPGADSRAGFLGKDESLLEVLAADNRLVVDELGLSHQEIARHLRIIGAIAVKKAKEKSLDIRYHGQTFRLSNSFSRGFQESPFDDGTKTNCNTTLVNVGSGKKLTFSLLVPEMIERYGFYEGKGTPYRVDPRAVLDVLGFVKGRRANP